MGSGPARARKRARGARERRPWRSSRWARRTRGAGERRESPSAAAEISHGDEGEAAIAEGGKGRGRRDRRVPARSPCREARRGGRERASPRSQSKCRARKGRSVVTSAWRGRRQRRQGRACVAPCPVARPRARLRLPCNAACARSARPWTPLAPTACSRRVGAARGESAY